MNGRLSWNVRACTAPGALVDLTGQWTVFVSTPTEFTVAVAYNGVLRCTGSTPWVLPERTFQLHAFNGISEMRWLARGNSGQAVFLAEDADILPGSVTAQRDFVDVIDSQAVLWGEPDGIEQDGFTAWSEMRVGTVHYPCRHSGGKAERVVLRSREYIDVDVHGNARVFDRRALLIEALTVSAAAQGAAG